jgi:hypothetical protein
VRSRQLVLLFIGIQIAIPAVALMVRLTTTGTCVPFGWHMFSCL